MMDKLQPIQYRTISLEEAKRRWPDPDLEPVSIEDSRVIGMRTLRFAWLPTETEDRGWIWLERYWELLVWSKSFPGQWWIEARTTIFPESKSPAARRRRREDGNA